MDFREYHALFRDLIEDYMKFFQYFRITHKRIYVFFPLDLPKPNTSGENTSPYFRNPDRICQDPIHTMRHSEHTYIRILAMRKES